MANYLVTGAAGFIGARVSEMLLDAGHGVIGWDNLNDAYDVRVKHWRLQRLTGRTGFVFQQIDISDWASVQSASLPNHPVDGIINLAARAGVRHAVENPWIYVETNMTGTLNLLELCRQQDISKFILASTSSIYGANPPLPTTEDASSDYPLQQYAASKKGAETMCYVYHHLYGIDVTVFRFFTVYGPAGRPDMSMFRFAQWISEGKPIKLYGDGEQSRGFTYIDDIARGVILGLQPLGYEIINLGGHENITMNQLIIMLEKLIGRKAMVEHLPFNPADVQANQASVEKARQMLGWEPQVSLQEGVSRLVQWYQAEREWTSSVQTI
jgi:UDP-glucuronate 4-epimerase